MKRSHLGLTLFALTAAGDLRRVTVTIAREEEEPSAADVAFILRLRACKRRSSPPPAPLFADDGEWD